MKHKQNSFDAWTKIGIAAVLIVAAFGLLLFFEGKINEEAAEKANEEVTGMAPKNPGFSKVSSVVLKENIPQIKTIDIVTGAKEGYFGKDTFELILVGGNISGGNASYVLGLKLNKDLKNVFLYTSLSLMGYSPEEYPSTTVKLVKNSAKTIYLGTKDNNQSVQVSYMNWKYDSQKKAYYPTMKLTWVKEKALDLSDGLAKQGLKMLDGKENFIYGGKEHKGLSIGGKTYSFKLVSDPSGEVAVYFNKLSESVEITKSTTFPVENNGKVKVTVLGWEGVKLVADVQWIKPTG